MTSTSRPPVSREPVVWATAIAGILAALVSVGVLSTAEADTVNGVVTALVGAASFLLPLIGGLIARAKTTPLADPRDARGRQLTPAGNGPVHRADTQ